MTEYAIPGTAHQTMPTWLDEWEVGLAYIVLPWLCPACGEAVAETVVSRERTRPKTIVVGFSPVRMPEADEDGVPFYGMTRRAMRGKSERRATERLERGAQAAMHQRRKSGSTERQADHAPIELLEFDTLCAACPRRLRIRLP